MRLRGWLCYFKRVKRAVLVVDLARFLLRPGRGVSNEFLNHLPMYLPFLFAGITE